MAFHRFPDRPVRAVFPSLAGRQAHKVLPVTASCRHVLRLYYVYTISDPCVSIVFPHDGPVTVSGRFLLPSSGRSRSPAFNQEMDMGTDTLFVHPRAVNVRAQDLHDPNGS